MKKGFILSAALMCVTVLFVQAGQAQLINYNRRQKKPAAAAKSAAPRAAVSSRTSTAVKVPAWMITAPRVTNRYERLYDTDRNQVLDADETKELLRDVVSDVNRRGQIRISTEILNDYDTNNDGRISNDEVARIAYDLRR